MSIKRLFFSWFFLLRFICFAQNPSNEYSNFECSYSKLITIPNTFYKDGKTNAHMPLQQTVFYEHRDQFSYWYKVVSNEDQLIKCKLDPINNNDSYVLYVYNYSKENFCAKAFSGKVKPFKSSVFINNTEKKEIFELSDFHFNIKKNEIYYFCVLTVSPTNCGHHMRIIAGKDTFRIKALHIPCNEEEISVSKDKLSKKKELTNKKNTEQKGEYIPISLNVKEEGAINKMVDARLKIKDELTGNSLILESTGENGYKLEIEKGKSYSVECVSTGYKTFNHSIVISEYLSSPNNLFDIFLRPLKSGDNFVMNNIYFHPNTYALRKGSEKEIDYLLTYLKNNPAVIIELQGHTNGNKKIYKNKAYKSKGAEWNFKGSSRKLSRYRAESIKKYLVTKGIDSKRITIKGFGGDRFIVENAKTLDDVQKNVRVEVLIL